jgi:hypothetical protein
VEQEVARILFQATTRTSTAAGRGAAMLMLSEKSLDELQRADEGAERAMEVLAEDLANAETTGYRGRQSVWGASGRPEARLDLTQGRLDRTGRTWDVGISGPGFVRVRTKDGVAYTRCGALFVSETDELVLSSGEESLQLDPPVRIPRGTVAKWTKIDGDGEIDVVLPGATARTNVGRIWVHEFRDATRLQWIGGGAVRGDRGVGGRSDGPIGDGEGEAGVPGAVERGGGAGADAAAAIGGLARDDAGGDGHAGAVRGFW